MGTSDGDSGVPVDCLLTHASPLSIIVDAFWIVPGLRVHVHVIRNLSAWIEGLNSTE